MMVLQLFNKNYQNRILEEQMLFAGAFRKIDLEIWQIRAKINQQQGFWIFKTHVYSRKTLFDEINHSNILKILDNINEIARVWSRNGVLTRNGCHYFLDKHEEILDKLQDIYVEIQRRDPTWWETISEAFIGFIDFVRRGVPQLAIGLLMGVASHIPALQPFVGFFLKNNRLSPYEIKLLEAATTNYINGNNHNC